MSESIAFILRRVDARCLGTVHLQVVINEDAENDYECHLESDQIGNVPPVQHEMLRAHDATASLQPSARLILPGTTLNSSCLSSFPYILMAGVLVRNRNQLCLINESSASCGKRARRRSCCPRCIKGGSVCVYTEFNLYGQRHPLCRALVGKAGDEIVSCFSSVAVALSHDPQHHAPYPYFPERIEAIHNRKFSTNKIVMASSANQA